jgi:fumarate reductase iron-sulfur subunit
MKIKIRRYHPHFEPPSVVMEYEADPDKTLLENLVSIKERKDPTLAFSHGCRSGVCGSCAVRINGKEALACKSFVDDGDLIEPLSVVNVIRDLVCDKAKAYETIARARGYLVQRSGEEMDEEALKRVEVQSGCILCASCYSSCPVFEAKPSFLGPFALSRTYRYLADAREADKKSHIDAAVNDGIWDCTLCGNCTEVCPQGIDPKNDILMLQSQAAMQGYTNPNMGSFGSFGLEF